MSLIDTINSFDASIKLHVVKPNQRNLERVYQKLLRISDGIDQISNELDQNIIENAINTLRSGEKPKLKTVKLICMGGLESISDLEDGKSLVERILNIVDMGTDSLIKAVFIGFLRIADEDNWLSSYLYSFLQKRISRLPKQWKSRCEEYGLLEKPFGTKLAYKILDSEYKSPHELLADAGLRGVLSASGFSRTVFIRVCAKLAGGHDPKLIRRFWDYIGSAPCLFANDIGSYTLALLSPYQIEEAEGSIRLDIERFLVNNFGDPRIKHGIYSRVSQELLSVLYRWLTQQSFNMLMEVVKRSNNTNHWKDRSQFWQYYIDNGYVSEAWVAFGSDAHFEARGLVRKGVLDSHGAYGRLERGSIQSMHSVIFMKIGDVTISEWTHDGKVRCYLKDNDHKPKLYRSSYSIDKIRRDDLADLAQSHYSNWQSIIKSYIYTHTGIENGSQNSRLTQNKSRKISKSTLDSFRAGKSHVTSCQACGKVSSRAGLNSEGLCFQCRGLWGRNR